MKSYNHLFESFISEDNYLQAVKLATKHKNGNRRKYRKAQFIKQNADELKHEMILYASNFYSFHHRPVEIYDGIQRKKRTIIVPTMKEQVVHHMIVNIMKPIWMRTMYEHSYGSIPDRGAHKAKKTIEHWIHRHDKDMKYCLKMDVRKFFDSIPHDILKKKLAEQIHDQKFLSVFYEVVDVVPKGIPLGFYTSQWIANWYLTELDHYIKEKLGVRYYVRYMDDMVCFGSNKKALHMVREAIGSYLHEELGLELKSNWQVFLFDYIKKSGVRVGRDLDFMGFRFFRDKTILRRSIMLKATRKAKRLCKKKPKTMHDCRQMLSYLGWIDCTDTYQMYKKLIKPFVSFRALRRRESSYQRMVNKLCGENLKMATLFARQNLKKGQVQTLSTSEETLSTLTA